MNFEEILQDAPEETVPARQLDSESQASEASAPARVWKDRLGVMAELYASLSAEEVVPLRKIKAETEIYVIGRTLERTRWNRRAAADLLKISYRGLLYKIRQYNIRPEPGMFEGSVEG
jgi:two-component system, NtrC family, response regulator AtoC